MFKWIDRSIQSEALSIEFQNVVIEKEEPIIQKEELIIELFQKKRIDNQTLSD